MAELEKSLRALIDLEDQRKSYSRDLNDLEEKLLAGKIGPEDFRREYARKKMAEKPFFEALRKQDGLILKTYDRAIGNLNTANQGARMPVLSYTYKPGYSLLKQINYFIEKSMPEQAGALKTKEEIVQRQEVMKAKTLIEKDIRSRMPELLMQIPIVKKEPAISGAGEWAPKFTTSMNKMFNGSVSSGPALQPDSPAYRQIGENTFTLIQDYAYAVLAEDDKHNKMYFVVEPKMEANEAAWLDLFKERLFEKVSLESLNKEKLSNELDRIIKEEGIALDAEQKDKILYFLNRDMYGLEKVEPLMHDPFIEDVECDGTNVPVFIVHRKHGHLKTNVVFEDVDDLRSFIIKLSQLGKAYVSFAAPLLDTILPDGSRVNAILTESVSTHGPTFTIRKFPENPLSPVDLIKGGMVNAELIAYLWTAIEFKRNVLIIGPTAAGKTTLLNALSMFIPDGQRIVSIEDTRELNLMHDNWLPQVSRTGFGPPDQSGKRYGAVELIDLIKESFRQRPDYLIVGEVRGEETNVMFQGMASGHTTLSTIHAKTIEDVVNRLITPPISLHPSLLNSLDIVVAVSFAGITTPIRRIREVDEMASFNQVNNRMEYAKLFEWQASMKIETSPEEEFISKQEAFADVLPLTYRSNVLKEVSMEFGIDNPKLLQIIKNRIDFLDSLVAENVANYIDFKLHLREFKRNERF